ECFAMLAERNSLAAIHRIKGVKEETVTVEHATLAPLLANLPLGQDDSFSSAVERIFIATNGPSQNGCANPRRQGLLATLTDGFRPNNTFGGIPTIALDHSPI